MPPVESMFDDRFARLKSNSGTSKGASIGDMPQSPVIMVHDAVPLQEIETQPIVVKSSFKRERTPSPPKVDKAELMR